jgi:DNA-binding GntR family transcriptional regulator
VLKIISSEVARRGACTLTVDTIADLASIDRSVVKVALRTAKAEGLIKVERGRVDQTPSPFRSRSAAGKGAASD